VSLSKPIESYKRFSIEEIGQMDLSSVDTNPFIPEWINFNPHPKLVSSKGDYKLLKKINGKLVYPFYGGVFGNDDRQVYYPEGYPWHCIGKLIVYTSDNSSYSGSAVLVGRSTILTAGHVIPWDDKGASMKFIPAFYDGDSALGEGICSWIITCHGYEDQGVSAWDMAICQLEIPLGNDYGCFGAQQYTSRWEGGNYWTLAGYPMAIQSANVPSRIMWFPIVDEDPEGDASELEFFADIGPGNSGGPVFGFWDDGPRVIGTISGGEYDFDLSDYTFGGINVSAGGKALVDLVRFGRNNWG
jgi:V8-like Glu-specific endopeptidase